MTLANIKAAKPDVTILATGTKPFVPPYMPGIDKPLVTDYAKVLLGEAKIGENAVIIGGRNICLTTAEFLSEHGCKCTIIDDANEIGADVGGIKQMVVLPRIADDDNITVRLNSNIERIGDDWVEVQSQGHSETLEDIDMVVFAWGQDMVRHLADEIAADGTLENFRLIGDPVWPRAPIDIIYEGAIAGRQILPALDRPNPITGASDVWLLLEAAEGKLDEFTDGLMRKGRSLVDALGGGLSAVLLGPASGNLEEAVGKFGVNRFYSQCDTCLADCHPEIYTAILTGLVQRHQPRLFLSLATSLGADLMPRLAAAVGAPLVMNCSDIEAAEEIEYSKRVQGGRLQAAITATVGDPNLATLDPAYLPDLEDSKSGLIADLHETTVDLATIPTRPHVTGRNKADPETVDIREAEIVLALGNGIGAKDNLAVFEQFADLIGAALGGLRPVIDSGVLSHERQIDQSGRDISARLAILCGISGSEYFTKGIERAATKIAINSDRDAAIFKYADLGIVANVNALIPKLTAYLKQGAKDGGA